MFYRLSLAQVTKAEAGQDVHVATPDYNKQITQAGCTHHTIILDHGSLNFIKDVDIFSLLELSQKLKPNIVDYFTVKFILYAGISARLALILALINALTGFKVIFITQSKFMRLLC